VNPFSKYRGVKLNGRFIESADLKKIAGKDSFEKDVLSYCHYLFDSSALVSIQTSGSTGTPKVLEFQKSALIQSATATNDFFGLNSESTALLSLPLAYVAAKLMVVRAIIGEFNLLTVSPRSNPLKHLSEAISFVPLTPHQVKTILAESPESFGKVDTVLLGGGSVSAELSNQLLKSNSTFYAGFGMAETLTHFALSEMHGEKELIYKVLPGVRINPDERGCLVINRPGITNGDLVTNDLIELTHEGFRWLGRIDNLINSGGVKIIPEEVEKLLKPEIDSRFFVAGIPDAILGQKAVLFVEGEEALDLDEIKFAQAYQKPKQIIRLKNFLYTSSGKIRRNETTMNWLRSSGG